MILKYFQRWLWRTAARCCRHWATTPATSVTPTLTRLTGRNIIIFYDNNNIRNININISGSLGATPLARGRACTAQESRAATWRPPARSRTPSRPSPSTGSVVQWSAGLSLVQYWPGFALIGWILMLQALLCHEEPTQGTQSPLLGIFLDFRSVSLWHKDRWLPCTERIYYREPSLHMRKAFKMVWISIFHQGIDKVVTKLRLQLKVTNCLGEI